MRAIWKGHISFGLVSVPVSIYSAEKRADLQLHMLDSRNHARVRYERVNAETGEEVPWGEIVRGYEYDNGSYVVISDEQLKKAAPEATKAIELEGFVDVDEIDEMFFDKPYYLEPGKAGKKGYALLREALRESGKAGIARVVIRTRQYIAALTPKDKVLVLTLLRYGQELRSPEELELPGTLKEVGVTDREIKMAGTLIDSMTRPWDPEEYEDEYRDALMAWIQKRIESGQIEEAPEAAEPEVEEVSTDLMEALKRSVEHSGAGERKPGRAPARKKRSKKTRSKKAAAAKSASKSGKGGRKK